MGQQEVLTVHEFFRPVMLQTEDEVQGNWVQVDDEWSGTIK